MHSSQYVKLRAIFRWKSHLGDLLYHCLSCVITGQRELQGIEGSKKRACMSCAPHRPILPISDLWFHSTARAWTRLYMEGNGLSIFNGSERSECNLLQQWTQDHAKKPKQKLIAPLLNSPSPNDFWSYYQKKLASYETAPFALATSHAKHPQH